MEPKKQQKLEDFKGQTRLPKFAIPKRYDLTLKPNLSTSHFSGTVSIDISIVDSTRFLVLNALDLVVGQVSFTTNSTNYKCVPRDVVVDTDNEILMLGFDDDLELGDGVLEIGFSGVLSEHLKGFYRGTYVDGGVKKNMAVTQFEPADARACFPCWDEPALKATFKITVGEVPLELTALSNMPVSLETIDGHLKTVHFDESPIMSTYLVAVVIGSFDHIEDTTSDGIRVRAYCPVGKSEQGKLALSIAVKALDLYRTYFSTPYPLPKLDMVAVPDFSGGAMENHGLIIYQETELLHDDFQSAAANTQRLAIVVTHEVGHHWFGNLVTMEWWTDLWLNEGFATWVSYLATDSFFPDWKIWTQFLDVTTGGLRMDALEQSHPVEVEIHSARSVLEIFDAVSYGKGSSLVRMLQVYLGDDIFQKSLSLYMKRYAYKNASTEDLWSVLSEISGVEVNKIMHLWTKQKGYPVIHVKSKGHVLEFEQLQFMYSGLHSDAQWIVPLTLSLGSYNRRKNFLLETKVGRIDITDAYQSYDESSHSPYEKNQEEFAENSWIKVNVGQTGFYRVKYDDELTARLRKAVEDNCLSAEDKFGILDDAYALCQACEVSLSSLLSLMDVYRNNLDYLVLTRLITVCYDIAKILKDAIPDLGEDLKQFFIDLILFAADKLGWESVSGESHLNAMLREEVLLALATFGHKKTIEEAMKRFQTFVDDKNTSAFPVYIRKAAYNAIMSNSTTTNRSGFDSLLKVYREADSVQEKNRILRFIARCPEPDIVLEVLNFMLSDEVRDQDSVFVTSRISLEAREAAWIWFKENWDLIVKRWGIDGFVMQNFVRHFILPFCSHEKADEVEEFYASRAVPSFAMNLKQSIELVRIKARWIEKIKQEEPLVRELVKRLTSRG